MNPSKGSARGKENKRDFRRGRIFDGLMADSVVGGDDDGKQEEMYSEDAAVLSKFTTEA